MSDEINDGSSPSTGNESLKMVPMEEHDRVKRKLEETEAELQMERKKLKKLETLVATGVNFRPTREKIFMTLSNCAELFAQREFMTPSECIKLAGFNWMLRSEKDAKNPDFMSLYLWTHPSPYYDGAFKFQVDIVFHVLNTISPSMDIHVPMVDQKFKGCGGDGAKNGFSSFVEFRKLLNRENGFLRADGSIKIEADFTVKTATLDHFLADLEDSDEDNFELDDDKNNGEDENPYGFMGCGDFEGIF